MNALGSGVHWAQGARRVWRVARWVLLGLIVAYIAIVIYSIPHALQEEKDAKAIAQIQAQKLIVNDVDGNHLPPPPDPAKVDATIAGIDANGNGIRDDVELAIFEKYPGKANEKIRAAELQYAMELQNELSNVFDTPTLISVVKQEGRGFLCISNDKYATWVESLVFNTDQRRNIREDLRQKYMASFGLDTSHVCDIDFNVK